MAGIIITLIPAMRTLWKSVNYLDIWKQVAVLCSPLALKYAHTRPGLAVTFVKPVSLV